MKTNDLMVGDWLNIYTFPNDNPKEDDLFPAKVSAVSVFDPFKEPDDVLVELVIEQTKGIASRPLDTCLPIELTEEILVKNGFELGEEIGEVGVHIYRHTVYKTDNFSLRVYNDNTFHFASIKLTYVHQLQHLLRLCNVQKEIKL